jgi:hypoxanthine phosphoribosyltransferase
MPQLSTYPDPTACLLNDLSEVLCTREQIEERLADMGRQIAADIPEGDLLLIGVLKGGAYFLCDLSRSVPRAHAIDFMGASSYGNATTTSGHVKITKDLDSDVRGKHVVICEDIYDTGHTLRALKSLILTHAPASVRLAAMLYKR